MVSRVIFDTNIYGRIIEKSELDMVISNMHGHLLNYGSVVVKQELKAYEGKRTLHYDGKVRKFRALLLEAYEFLVKKTYEIDDKTNDLAGAYFTAYKKLGGKKSHSEIINDFLIVATASIHQLEIIYTEDKEGGTMRAPEALKAYEIINELSYLEMPKFRSYEQLRSDLKIKRWSS